MAEHNFKIGQMVFFRSRASPVPAGMPRDEALIQDRLRPKP